VIRSLRGSNLAMRGSYTNLAAKGPGQFC